MRGRLPLVDTMDLPSEVSFFFSSFFSSLIIHFQLIDPTIQGPTTVVILETMTTADAGATTTTEVGTMTGTATMTGTGAGTGTTIGDIKKRVVHPVAILFPRLNGLPLCK